jgi:glycosyltransferase involved in cell wall biosynthesis
MRLAIILPCYNEEASLPVLLRVLDQYVKYGNTIVCVDDGSTDGTWKCLERHPYVLRLRVTENRGHQAAILRGLLSVRLRCDCAITMDADGQHPPSAIPDFIAAFKQGADIVYGVRRRNHSLASRLFYKLMGDSIIPNHGDFRLISARVLDTLTEESELFLRGLFASYGRYGVINYGTSQSQFKTAIVEYDEQPRIAGKSTYTLRKRIALFVHALKWRFSHE